MLLMALLIYHVFLNMYCLTYSCYGVALYYL